MEEIRLGQDSENKQDQIKYLILKYEQIKLELKDVIQRLNKSEQIKESTFQELERLESENRFFSDENKELRSTIQNKQQLVEQLLQQNSQLKHILQEKANFQDDFLIGIEEQMILHLDKGQSQIASESRYTDKEKPSSSSAKNLISRENSNEQSLPDFKKVLNTLSQLQSDINYNNKTKEDQPSIKQMQELALLKQRVELLENNNHQLFEACNFQKETYHQVKNDFDILTMKYQQLKEKHSSLKEIKDRLEGQAKSLQGQLTQLQNELKSSDSKAQHSHQHLQDISEIQPESPERQNYSMDQQQQFYDGNRKQQPVQSLFDELNFALNHDPYQNATDQKELNQENECKAQKPSEQIDNDMVKKNNELLNLILSKLSEVQTPASQCSQNKQGDKISNDIQGQTCDASGCNTHSKKMSSSTNFDKQLSLNTSNHKNSGNYSNNSLVDFDGSVFPTLCANRTPLQQPENGNDLNIFNKLKSLFSRDLNTSQATPRYHNQDEILEYGESSQLSEDGDGDGDDGDYEQEEQKLESIIEPNQEIQEQEVENDEEFNISQQDEYSELQDQNLEEEEEESPQQAARIPQLKINIEEVKSRNGQQYKSTQGPFKSEFLTYYQAFQTYSQNSARSKNSDRNSARNNTSNKPLNTTLMMRSSLIGNYLLSSYASQNQNEQ